MTTEVTMLKKYTADEGKVFDWRLKEGEKITDHLYAKTIFLGKDDSIDNYIEIEAPVEEEAANEDKK